MDDMVLDFEKIHANYRAKIERYLTRLVGPQEAEDLTQEVLLKISRALLTFRGESKLSTWIYRIATNTALDRLRDPSFKHITQNDLPNTLDMNERQVDCENGAIETDTLSPEHQVCQKERYACYREFIQDLPPNYRTVVALSELEELATVEIADILGLSVDVVKIRLHRGRVRLINALKSHCKPEDWL